MYNVADVANDVLKSFLLPLSTSSSFETEEIQNTFLPQVGLETRHSFPAAVGPRSEPLPWSKRRPGL